MNKTQKFEIFFVRHGDTVGACGTAENDCDLDLNQNGVMQAQLLADRFFNTEFDAVFSSPLQRAVKTAAAVCKKLKNEPQLEIMPELIETNTFPFYSGADEAYIKSIYQGALICADTVCSLTNGNFDGFAKTDDYFRACRVVDYFRSRFGFEQKILVFSHGSFGCEFIKAAAGIKDDGFIFSLNNTSVTKIKYTSDGKTRLSFVNDVSHLRKINSDFDFTV